MKKFYVAPEMEVEKLYVESLILTASGGEYTEDGWGDER